MARLNIQGIAFDMYGNVVDVGEVADTVRIYKPSPRVYQLAPRAMKLKKQHILFVSSNSFDVVGAKSFGFRVCWINRAGAPLDPLGPRPDVTVKNFDELGASVN